MKKWMKAWFIVSLMLCLFPVSTYARDVTYILDELEMELDIPDECVVFTRETDRNDPNLARYGLTKEKVVSQMIEDDIYLVAWDQDMNYEIQVTMTENTSEDFKRTSNNLLMEMASSMEGQKGTVTYSNSQIVNQSYAKFMKFDVYQELNGQDLFGLIYYTVCDKKAINIKLTSYTGEVDEEKEELLEEIVKWIYFYPTAFPSSIKTPSFVYTDEISGIQFTVPENWSEDTDDKLDKWVKFTSNEEAYSRIGFVSIDLFDEMTEEEKKQYTRQEMDNSFITEADVAYVCPNGEYTINKVSYSGQEYYCAKLITDGLTYEEMTLTPTVYFMRCENGYLFMFQFYAEPDTLSPMDVINVMESVTCPDWSQMETKESQEVGTDPDNPALRDLQSQFHPVNIIVNLLVTIAVYSLPIFIYRYVVRKEPVERKKAKRITIFYAVVAFFLMSGLEFLVKGGVETNYAIWLWSWVNYKVLTRGYEEPVAVTSGNEDSRIP